MEIVRRGPITVIGIAVEASFDRLSTVVPDAWSRLWSRFAQIPGRSGEAAVEISFELGGGRYREVVGAEVDPSIIAPAGLMKIELPEAEYARTIHEGSLVAIAKTFGELQAFARAEGRAPDGVLIDKGYEMDRVRPHELLVRLSSDR